MGMTSLKQDSADSLGEYRAPNFGYGRKSTSTATRPRPWASSAWRPARK